MHGVVFERDDAPANAALGGDAVAGLQFANHLLPLLLPPLLGQDQQEIENGEDRQHQEQSRPEACLPATLQQICAYLNFTH